MKITICGSIDFTYKTKEITDILLRQGHEVEIPFYSQKILNGELSMEKFLKTKQKNGDADFRKKAPQDLIRRYFRLIKDSDVILVVNIDKNGIKNYIGGNTFLEMGFAHILNKKIFLWNPIPEIPYYKSEIEAVKPIIINRDLSLIN